MIFKQGVRFWVRKKNPEGQFCEWQRDAEKAVKYGPFAGANRLASWCNIEQAADLFILSYVFTFYDRNAILNFINTVYDTLKDLQTYKNIEQADFEIEEIELCN